MGLEIWAGISAGIFSAIVFALLYFKDNKLAWSFVPSTGIGISYYAVYSILKDRIDGTTSDSMLMFTTFYFISMCGAIIVSFIIMYVSLKRSDTTYKLTLHEFIFSNEESINDYFISKKTEVDSLLNIEEVEKLNHDLDRKKSLVSQKEMSLINREKQIKKMLENITHIKLPIDNEIPISDSFINQLPHYIDKLVSLIRKLELDLENILNDYKKSLDKELDIKMIILEYYIESICINMAEYLFNIHDVKIHFRYLNTKGYYEKLLIVHKGEVENGELKTIHCDQGMICQAGKERSSLIKSLNHEHHIIGTSDNRWQEYMVLVFSDFYENNKPILSMDIAVKSFETYRDMLYFLNYCRIENIIGEFLKDLDKNIDIKDVLNSIYEDANIA